MHREGLLSIHCRPLEDLLQGMLACMWHIVHLQLFEGLQRTLDLQSDSQNKMELVNQRMYTYRQQLSEEVVGRIFHLLEGLQMAFFQWQILASAEPTSMDGAWSSTQSAVAYWSRGTWLLVGGLHST